MITRLGNIQVGKGQYLYKTGRHICGTKSTEPMSGSGVLRHVHRLVKGEQNETDNEQVIEEDHRIKGTLKDKGDNACFVWLPPLLSATPLGTVSGMSCDLCVDWLAAKDTCMHRSFLEKCNIDNAVGSCKQMVS